MTRPARNLPKAPKGRALETLALAPVALGALLAHASAADASEGKARSASLKGNSAPVLGMEEALAQGRAELKAGRVVEALQSYQQALSWSPESVEALNAVAVCYDRLGKFDTSRTFYETALGIDPHSPLLLNNYGYSLYLQGERTQATRFLALAIATGDEEVQAAAMRILAKIEAEGRSAPALAGPANPVVRQAIAEEPQPTPGQPQIVRTSAHEVRLVLGDAPPPPAAARRGPPSAVPAVAPRPVAPAILAEALGPAAAAILPVAALSSEEDRVIADAEAAAIRREAIAAAVQAQRQAQALSAAQTAAVPAMMQAMIDLALGARPVHSVAFAGPADLFGPSRPARPEAADPEWNRYQLLVTAERAIEPGHAARTNPSHRLLVAGVLPVRPDLRAADQSSLPAAEPITRKRLFEQPFASDDARLNGFAERLHGADEGPDVDEQVARLQALIANAASA